ncbi:MAG TPA: sulfurtransferase [Casimicrobiaceae bacterium]|nr:sulfurtransferase [Casimicrobiaceae bacterium]
MPRTTRHAPYAAVTTGAPGTGDTRRHATLIGAEDLARHIGDPSWVVVDLRHDLMQPERYGIEQYELGHSPGAAFASLDSDLSAPTTGRNGRHPLPTPEFTAAVFGRLGIDATKQVVAYDQDQGAYASRLWWMMRWLGHDAVAVLDGGFAKWVRDGHPVSTEPGRPQAATFAPRNVLPTISASGVAASLSRRSLVLLDARAAERYRGDVEPIDRVAGHIPGALNRPYTRNLAADGTFRSPQELRADFEGMLHGRSAGDLVHYCGSGVSACHNVLAMTAAGYPLTRLYPGSWSEWSSDPRRPVAKGQV